MLFPLNHSLCYRDKNIASFVSTKLLKEFLDQERHAVFTMLICLNKASLFVLSALYRASETQAT